MQNSDRVQLHGIELGETGLSVRYSDSSGESSHGPSRIVLRPAQVEVAWKDAPRKLENAVLEWEESPFQAEPLRISCRVGERNGELLTLHFSEPMPRAYGDLFETLSSPLNRKVPDPAVRASRLYTIATVVSASGLLCGALAIIFPILIGDAGWADVAAKLLLALMVLSIGAFAVLRAMAGREEVRAIDQGRA